MVTDQPFGRVVKTVASHTTGPWIESWREQSEHFLFLCFGGAFESVWAPPLFAQIAKDMDRGDIVGSLGDYEKVSHSLFGVTNRIKVEAESALEEQQAVAFCS